MFVTLALTAFGLVMVYSATSASAALGNGNPIGYLQRQGMYAAVGLVLLVVAARSDFRRLRRLAPTLVVAALGLCAAVLVIGERINGARRWIGFGPATFQPSELAKLALVVWCAAYLARRPPPRTLKDLARPIGLLVGVFCLLVLVEPDLGTVITIVLMVGAMLLVTGRRCRRSARPTLSFSHSARSRRGRRRTGVHASSRSSIRGRIRSARGCRTSRHRSASGRAGSSVAVSARGSAEDPLPA